ncbi:MAG: hypothetical protein ACR2HP_07285 [Ilumatobacteraceae bacterium]
MKALRAQKDRDSATAVAAIRRPAWSDWAINVTSGSHPDEVVAFAVAAENVRTAQEAAIEGRPADVRQALRDLRERTTALVTAANRVLRAEAHTGGAPELQARLSEVAGSEETVEQLRRGILGTGDPAADDLFAGLTPSADRPRAAKSPTKRPTKGSAPKRRAADPPAPAAAERRRLMRAVAEAERDLQRSQRAAHRAEEDVIAAQEAADLAQQRLDEAQQRFDAANDVVGREQAARDQAAAALDATS